MLTLQDAINAGMFTQEAIKEDEQSIKALDKLPANMRDAVLRTMEYKSFKYGKKSIEMTGITNEIIIKELVKVDKLTNQPNVIYCGTLYKTDNQISKLSTILENITMIDSGAIRAILIEMLNLRKEELKNEENATRNPVFDKSMLHDSLDNILKHENYKLDMALMAYKTVVGIDANGNEIYSTVTFDVLHTAIATNENARAINLAVKPLTKELVEYIKYYNNTVKTKALAEIIDNTKYNPAYDDFFPKFAKYVHETMNIAEDVDVFTVGLAQLIWNIKRLTRELPTYNDLIISIKGEQGIGKGYMVNSIFGSVLGAFYAPSTKLSEILDERRKPALANMLLMNIDEGDVGGSGFYDSKNMAGFKSIITNDYLTHRPLYTNQEVTVRKKVSFISTSNHSIHEVMNDSTGMRRFLEFNSKNARQQRFDYERTTKIAQLSLKAFQAIDETRDYGYWDLKSETGKKITAIQDAYVKKPLLDEFLAERLDYVADIKFADCITLDRIYDDYCNYAREMNENSKFLITKRNFRAKIEAIIPDCTKMSARVYKFKFVYKKINAEDCPSFTPTFGSNVESIEWFEP